MPQTPPKNTPFNDLHNSRQNVCLTHSLKSPEEALRQKRLESICSVAFDSPAAQARLPVIVAAASNSLSRAQLRCLPSREAAIASDSRRIELGASSVYCSASSWIIEAWLAKAFLLSVTLERFRATPPGQYSRHGKTAAEAKKLYAQLKQLESAGAYAAEPEWSLTNSLLPLHRKPRCSSVPRFRSGLRFPISFLG